MWYIFRYIKYCYAPYCVVLFCAPLYSAVHCSGSTLHNSVGPVYTPVFRQNELWFGAVRPSIRPCGLKTYLHILSFPEAVFQGRAIVPGFVIIANFYFYIFLTHVITHTKNALCTRELKKYMLDQCYLGYTDFYRKPASLIIYTFSAFLGPLAKQILQIWYLFGTLSMVINIKSLVSRWSQIFICVKCLNTLIKKLAFT